MEGLASSFMFTLGGLGFIVLDQTHTQGMPSLNRIMLQVGFAYLPSEVSLFLIMKLAFISRTGDWFLVPVRLVRLLLDLHEDEAARVHAHVIRSIHKRQFDT